MAIVLLGANDPCLISVSPALCHAYLYLVHQPHKGSIMKNLLLSAFFVLAVSSAAFAHFYPSGNDEWGQTEEQSSINNSLAWRLCQEAAPSLYHYTGMTGSQLYAAYEDGMVTITYLGVDPQDSHKSLYRVSAGGGDSVLSILEDI